MTLARYRCEGFRNLKPLNLALSPGLNLFYGVNGAGKTSLLEAVHFLSRARSFRTRKSKDLIQTDIDHFTVSGDIVSETGRQIPAGLQRNAERTRLRIDGQDTRDVGRLSALLPLQVLTTESHELITGGPGHRRRFLDWGVFHVEHSYLALWQRYTRTLRQRNAAIRSQAGVGQVRAWDSELAEAAELIDKRRQMFLKKYINIFNKQVDRLFSGEVKIQYRRGWDRDLAMHLALVEQLQGDLRQGFTRFGPHRADIKISVDDKPAREWLSRGQQRQLVIAMLLAQSRLLAESRGHAGLFLLDDLGAELDQDHRVRVIEALMELGCQAFVTQIDPDTTDLSVWQERKVFHVEHGLVTEVV